MLCISTYVVSELFKNTGLKRHCTMKCFFDYSDIQTIVM